MALYEEDVAAPRLDAGDGVRFVAPPVGCLTTGSASLKQESIDEGPNSKAL